MPYLPGVLITWEVYSLFLPTGHMVPGDNIQNLKINNMNDTPVLHPATENPLAVAQIVQSFGINYLSMYLSIFLFMYLADLVNGKWWQDCKILTLLSLPEESITLDYQQ